jgi:cytochrome c-type biogenesis protein CcmE
MNRFFKFGIPVAAIVGTVVWLGVSSTKATSEYYVKIPELMKMDSQTRVKRMQVEGYVKEGSIVSQGQTTTFVLMENPAGDPGEQLKVVYTGNDMPDTFKDHAQATAIGALAGDGVFRANKLTAKCASKYEAAPPKLPATSASNKI